MSCGFSKKRSGFQITNVISDFNVKPVSQSACSIVTILQSSGSSAHGSSSQPTTPSLHRKYASHEASRQGAGTSFRFRVVRLAGGGSNGRSESYRRGRWTCSDFLERQEGIRFKRVMDNMRHAHSLESLEMIGRSHTTSHLLPQPIRVREGAGLVMHSRPPSPTHQQPINIHLRNSEPMERQALDLTPQNNNPSPLQLDVDAVGQFVLRLSPKPSPAPSGLFHPVLGQTIFSLPGDDSGSNRLVAIDNKIEQAMDLVKGHLMLTVREEHVAANRQPLSAEDEELRPRLSSPLPLPLFSSSVPHCPELDLSVTLSPAPKITLMPPKPHPLRESQQNNQMHHKLRLQKRNRQVCFEEPVVVMVTSEPCETLRSHTLSKQPIRGHCHGQRAGPPASAESGCLEGAGLNSLLALKAELEAVQGSKFNSHKAVQEVMQRSERTKTLINSRATDGVNVSRSQILFSSLVSVDMQEGQLIGQALQDRLVVASPTRNHDNKGADCPSLLVFLTFDLQRQKPLQPDEEELINTKSCPGPVPCPAHLTFDLYRRQRHWETMP
ncbi:hypothetical protein LDENG_00235100 [Lucifuga dentata]|nr:hypothetical protein LDENG_00235100 [Lucifuga dentata]